MDGTPPLLSSASDPQIETVAGYLKPSMELLVYYRQKVVAFERERAEYLERLAVVERHNGELHRLRWELRSREEEIEELQKCLGDAKVILFDEREQVLKLQAENDALKSQELEDRRRIQHLLAMTEPVTRETTFFREARPSTARLAQARSIAEMQDAAAAAAETRPVHKRSGTVALSTVGRAGFAIKRAPSPAATSIAQQRIASETDAAPPSQRDAPDGVTDGVSHAGLPSATALRKQLLDLRALEASRVEAFRADRLTMREQYDRKSKGDNVRIAQLEKQTADLQDKLTALTRDYLVQRYTLSVKDRERADALAEAEALRLTAEADAARVSQQAAIETRVLRGAADQQARALQHLRSSSEVTRVQDARIADAQRASQVEILLAETDSCRAELAKERERYRALQRRRALEIEGFHTDVSQLRAAMRRVEKQWALVHGVVADAALTDQMHELDRAYTSISERTAAAARDAVAAAAVADLSAPFAGAAHKPTSPRSDAVAPPRIPVAAHLARPDHAGGGQSEGGDLRDATRGGAASWAGLVYPPKLLVTPAPGSQAVQDPHTRSRMRRNGSLLTDNPVVYRVIRSSGYRESGTRGAVDGDLINTRARSTSRSKLRPESAGGGYRDEGGQSAAATLLSDVLAAGERRVGFEAVAAEEAYEDEARLQSDGFENGAALAGDEGGASLRQPRGPKRVPVTEDSGDGDTGNTGRMRSELLALKARVGTMQTLAERTAAVLVR